MIHTGTQTFETERLLCRPFLPADYGDMLANWAADPDVQAEYGEPVYTTLTEVKTLLSKYLAQQRQPDCYRWAIVEKVSNQNIGQIAFCRVYSDSATAEIEYCIGKAFWGRGYATEALCALIHHAWTKTHFTRLEAYHRAENVRSGRVLQKSSMHQTDTVERFAREGITPEGEICYCIEKSP